MLGLFLPCDAKVLWFLLGLFQLNLVAFLQPLTVNSIKTQSRLLTHPNKASLFRVGVRVELVRQIQSVDKLGG